MRSEPESAVSVVVATHNRPELLRLCLASLAAQTRPPDEVIVVDDGSRPPVSGLELPPLLNVRLVRNDVARGPGRARNVGWRLARPGYVVFTDDDCRATPGWLAALLVHAREDRIVVGRVAPDPEDGPIRTMLDRSMRVEADDGRYSTCNVLYPSALLERLGGFDDSFDLYGEDTDLGQRARAVGAGAVFVPEALVHHAVHRLTLGAFLRERRRIGESARLRRRHPNLRRPPTGDGIWLSRDHRNVARALAGIAVLTATPSGAFLAVRWLSVAVRERLPEWSGPPARNLALLAIVDVTDLATCAAASIRHRTLLL